MSTAPWLTTADAARMLGVGPLFIQRRCKSGVLPAVRVGSDYRIARADFDTWLKQAAVKAVTLPVKPAAASDLLSLMEEWAAYLTGIKALAPDTIRTHQRHVRGYLKRMAALGDQPLTIPALFDRKTLVAVFAKIPAKSYAVKYNTYNALISLGRFLVDEGRLQASALAEVRTLKPRRQVEPRRTHLKPDDVPRMFDVILTRANPVADNLTFAAMAAVMVYAGLRASEVCHLRPGDVDLASRVLIIQHGKGGKNRRVGINNALYAYLKEYASIRPSGPAFFLQIHGIPFDRDMLSKRMRLISKRMGVDITCHGLRRTFATLAANQGRSVNSLRIALGHANLETTQAYLRTSEAEVIEAMKAW